MEIKVILPDAATASELAWHLGEPARAGRGRAGARTIQLETGDEVEHVLAAIRNWMKLAAVGPVTVHIGEAQDALGPDE